MDGLSLAEILAKLEAARAAGMPKPCWVGFSAASDASRATYARLSGNAIPHESAADGEEWGPALTVPALDLAAALEALGMPGSSFAARMLTDPVSPADLWAGALMADGFTFGGYLAGDKVMQITERYDAIPRGRQTPGEMMADDGPSRFPIPGVPVGGVGSIAVYGRTGADTILAAAIVSIMSTGRMFVPPCSSRTVGATSRSP